MNTRSFLFMESLVHAILSNAVAVTVMAVVVAALAPLCRRPALIHGLWFVVMLKLVTPPFVPVSVPVPVSISTAVPIAVKADPVVYADLAKPTRDVGAAEASEASPEELPFAAAFSRYVDPLQPREPSRVASAAWCWEHVVLGLVLSGAIAWWTLALLRIIRFQRVLCDLRPVPGDWQDRTEELAGRIGLAGVPSVSLVPGRIPPMLWAIGMRPRLLLPAELWSSISDDERTSLLLHELAHLKRRDHWVRWLELLVAGLYWWHPAAWYIRSALREAEEQCCDAWVVWAMPRGSKTYASALLAALEFVSGARTAPAVASATSGNGQVSCLKRRLKMIVRARTPKGLSWSGRLAILGIAALVLPLAPGWAQDKDKNQTANRGAGSTA